MTLDPDRTRATLRHGGVYVLTGVHFARGRSHEEIAAAAIAGGAALVQLRDKDADARTYYDLARRLHALCEQRGVPLIVNDRADVALAAGAEGVHLGQEDLPVAAARARATAAGRPQLVIGLSTHNPDQGRAGAASGADYLGVGPIYPTRTKDYCVGIDYVRWAAAELTLPWTVSGGVNAARLPELARAGARWIVVIQAVNEAADIAAATGSLVEQWEAARAAATRETET